MCGRAAAAGRHAKLNAHPRSALYIIAMKSSFISDRCSLEEDLRWGLFPLLFALSSSSLFPSRLGKVLFKASFVSVDESHSVRVPLRCASVIFHTALFESVCLDHVYKPCACGFYFIILLPIQKPAVITVPAVSSVPHPALLPRPSTGLVPENHIRLSGNNTVVTVE